MSTQQRPRAEQSELEVPLASIPQERLQLLAAERYSALPDMQPLHNLMNDVAIVSYCQFQLQP